MALIAEKGNRMVRIADERKSDYIAMGYTIKDAEGNVINKPDDPKKENELLKKQLSDMAAEMKQKEEKLEEAVREADEVNVAKETLETEIRSLKAENKTLKARLSDMTAKLKAASAAKAVQEASDNAPDAAKETAKDTEAKE